MDETNLKTLSSKETFFEGVETIHLSGSLLSQDIWMEKLMQQAKERGIKIFFNPFTDTRSDLYRTRILALLATYVDTLLITENEVNTLTHLPTPEAEKFLRNFCHSVTISSTCTASN